ncbi:MAG: N-acetyltransferase family protein [Steroidobacteraceae bacterium]
MKRVECTLERHGAAILAILNEAILNSTALYEYRPRAPESMAGWFAAKSAGRYPVIGLEDAAGELLGFASYGAFRPHAAYKYSVEHSVYVRADRRGQGIGRQLLQAVVDAAVAQGYHLLVGGIDATNRASIALHERLGFSHAGTIRQAGFKFGRWLDLAFYQLHLPTPKNPTDG